MKTTQTNTFKYLAKQLPIPTAFLNTSLELATASNSWLDFFDISQYECQGKAILPFFNPESQKNWKNCFQNCLNGEREFGIDSFSRQNDKEKWFEWTMVPWYDEDENIIGAILQLTDITKRLENELRYERLEHLLKDQLEIAKVGTWEYDIVTDSLIWSDVTKKIHEVSLDYNPNMEEAINSYKMGLCRNTISMLVHNGIHKGESWSQKLCLETKAGKVKWVISAGRPYFKNGKVTRLLGTIQDVTEQEEQQIKTKESEQLLQTLVDNLPFNLHIKDKSLKKILINKTECDYLGVEDPKEILGKSDFEIHEDSLAEIYREEDLKVMKTKKPILGKRTLNVNKDGTSTTFATSKIPLLDSKGDCKGIIGINMDISEIVQKENHLSDLINVTAIQNKRIINFGHIVSHNLRSHTANFSMLLNLLVKEDDESEKKRIVKMLCRASGHLMETLESLNEVVKIGTNVNREKKEVNFNEQINKVLENLSSFLCEHKAKIENTISDKATVRVVPAYMESIIFNLITNAVKYRHPERTPHIVLSTEKREDVIAFNVKDNGLGIDLEKCGSRLFGMYKTFHSNPDARGMGLYLTKNQVEVMGGSIMAFSEVNKGSTFSVYFKDEN